MATKKVAEPVDSVGDAYRVVDNVLDRVWPAGVGAGLALQMLRVAAKLWTRAGLDGPGFVDACSIAWRHAAEKDVQP